MEERSSDVSAQRAVEENARVVSERVTPEQLEKRIEAPPVHRSPAVQAEIAAEHRKAYGTAKTENLRDSGLWRILLPGFVVLCCLALLAIPLVILGWLLFNSLSGSAAANVQGTPLTWLWILMILIVLFITAVIIRGLLRVFMTQAGNYRT
jgi:hypothetical protein